MGIEFDWEINENDGDDQHETHRATAPWKRWGITALVFLIVGGIAGGIWWRIYSAELTLRRSVQSVLDLQHSAYQQGDGELFYASFPDDSFWRSVHLRPAMQQINAAGLTVSRAEQHDDIIWANLTWPTASGDRQRIAFFQESEFGLTHIENDPNFWGGRRLYEFAWGELRVLEADDAWKDAIANEIETTINSLNINGELAVPFQSLNVEIRNDFADSVSAETLYYPSPRLLGMGDSKGPDSIYFDGLNKAIEAHLTPVVIRYALPNLEPIYRGADTVYTQMIERFEAQFPSGQVRVELYFSDQLPGSPEQWLQTVDAAQLMPSQALLQTGSVYDLSWFVAGDTAFNTGDFFEQAWRAGWWDDRPWMVPWSSGVNLLYVDNTTFRMNGLEPPTEDTTLDELVTKLAELQANDPEQAGFVDVRRDLVYAYALSLDQRCGGDPGCSPELLPENVTAALTWYREILNDRGLMVDLSDMQDEQRIAAVLQALSFPKRTAAWIDSPERFEYQIALQSTGIMPLPPISAEIPLVMPLHINGHVMSAHTDKAWWTWQWLKFLSYQPTPNGLRNIPARPSVARQSGFWGWLPEQVAKPMSDVLPTARSLRIGDERYFSWEQLAAVRDGASINDAAKPIDPPWFLSQK